MIGNLIGEVRSLLPLVGYFLLRKSRKMFPQRYGLFAKRINDLYDPGRSRRESRGIDIIARGRS